VSDGEFRVSLWGSLSFLSLSSLDWRARKNEVFSIPGRGICGCRADFMLSMMRFDGEIFLAILELSMTSFEESRDMDMFM
jgi:hypothetical protein